MNSSLRDPTDVVSRSIALELLAELGERHAKLSDDEDSDALHHFRVSLRRLRSWLRAFEPHLPDLPRKARSRLRRIARQSNVSRDLEVQVAWLRARKAELSVRQRHGQEWLIARLEEQRRKEESRFEARLEKDMERVRATLEPALQRGSRTLADVPALPPRDSTSFALALAAVVRTEADRIRERLEAVQTPADTRDAHRARIEGKRLRYVLEPVAELVDADEALRPLKRLQDSLGEVQDCRVLSEAIAAALPVATRARTKRLAKLARDGALSDAALHEEDRHNVEAGLLALAKRVHHRSQEAFTEVERRWLGANAEPLLSALEGIAQRLERSAAETTYPDVIVPRTDDVALRSAASSN
jgi:CHAD domain-containing protein